VNDQQSKTSNVKKEGPASMNNENNNTMLTGKKTARYVARAGVLCAVAIVLMYLEFALPLVPTFLKFDFSEIAVLLAAFSMGPFSAILIELVKNLIHLPNSMTSGIGELANFVVGSFFVATAGLIYKYHKTRKGAFLGMLAGTVIMTTAACLINYFIMIPIYINVVGFPLPAIISATNAVGNTLVTDLKTLILYVFVPFNLFKGIVISTIVALIYKRFSPLLHR
jgi:riboflavin transporter FmnP